MKRVAYLWLTAGILAAFLAPLAAAQAAQSESLGDYARQVRKEKARQKSARGKNFDDETMPHIDTISVVGRPTPQNQAEDSAKAKSDTAAENAEDNAEGKAEGKSASRESDGKAPKNEAAERDKANKEWQKRLETQKSQIDLINRELDVLQREYRLKAAAMYADAGNRLRNSAQWDKEDADYKQKIAAKQNALDDAKQKLEDMKEDARKAGVPAPYRE